jgi:hypothetical protein
MAPVLKTGVPERVPGVRIPPSPPLHLLSSTYELVISSLISKWRMTSESPVQPYQTNPDQQRSPLLPSGAFSASNLDSWRNMAISFMDRASSGSGVKTCNGLFSTF